MNQVNELGRITKDLTLKQTNDTSYCNFSIAVKDGDNYVNYFNVVAWGKNAENITKYFSKGDRILVMGRLRQNRWEKDGKTNYSVQIVLEKFSFIETKNSRNNSTKNVSSSNDSSAVIVDDKSPVPVNNDDEDELPF